MDASSPDVMTRWLTDSRLHRPGVWAPEQVVDGDPFFAEMADRGVGTSLERRDRQF
jgi:hypothetical protein